MELEGRCHCGACRIIVPRPPESVTQCNCSLCSKTGFQGIYFAPEVVTVEGEFDVAISLNSFEHFPEPEKNLDDLAAAISPGGRILITFGSPWLSPKWR